MGGIILEDDKTLLDSIVVPDAIIFVHQIIVEDDSFTTIGKQKKEQNQQKKSVKIESETGFSGSLLSGNTKKDDENNENGFWTCILCTLQNNTHLSTCAACDSPAPKDDGSWVCSLCTCINEKEHSKCEACGTNKQ